MVPIFAQYLEIMASNILTNTTTLFSSTTGHTSQPLPEYAGYIGVVLAAIFFGSNFIPVKQFETGDGLFFQLIFCIAIWFCSVILHAIRGFPRFWPLAMLGGFLWCTGNIMSVPIIQCIGMAMGLLLWSMTNMLMGWASGRFGWFGLDAEVPNNQVMNYFGVATCAIGAIFVSQIKPHIVEPDDHSSSVTKEVDSEREPLIPPFSGDVNPTNGAKKSYERTSSTRKSSGSSGTEEQVRDDQHGDIHSLHHKLSPRMRIVAGVVMSLISGALYGSNFAPVLYIKNNYPKWYGNCTVDPCLEEASQKDIDYVFSHFTGIMVTSLLYFTIYCVYKKNKPNVYPKVMFPAILSGIMWAIADIGFFLANETLDESVSFPIVNAGPNVVATLWGVLWFREIQGKRNLLILLAAFCCIMGGSVLCGLSK